MATMTSFFHHQPLLTVEDADVSLDAAADDGRTYRRGDDLGRVSLSTFRISRSLSLEEVAP